MPELLDEVRYMDLYFIATGSGKHGMGNQVFGGIIRGLPDTQHSIKTMGCYEDGGSYSIPKEALSELGIFVDTCVDNHDSRDVEDLVRLLHEKPRTDSFLYEIKWNMVGESWEATEIGRGDDIELHNEENE